MPRLILHINQGNCTECTCPCFRVANTLNQRKLSRHLTFSLFLAKRNIHRRYRPIRYGQANEFLYCTARRWEQASYKPFFGGKDCGLQSAYLFYFHHGLLQDKTGYWSSLEMHKLHYPVLWDALYFLSWSLNSTHPLVYAHVPPSYKAMSHFRFILLSIHNSR